jgi:hypothetical protein
MLRSALSGETRTKKLKKRHLVAVVTLILVLVITGCAPSLRSSDASTDASDNEDSVIAAWSMQSECGVCHTNEASSFTDSGCLASKHSASACADCHDNETTLETTHADVKAESIVPKKLSKGNAVLPETCFSCHDSWEDLAEQTKDSSVLTDLSGTTVNPHDLPVGHTEEKLTCADCHAFHKNRDLTANAQNACLSCHHTGDYVCGTCHPAR